MFTPITPSNSYQHHNQSPLTNANTRPMGPPTQPLPQQAQGQPQAPTGYPVPDQRRVTSQPGVYHPTQVGTAQAPQLQAPGSQNIQYAPQRPVQSAQQAFAPAPVSQRSLTAPPA